MNDKLAIQPELMYSVQGGKMEESGSQVIMGQTFSYNAESKWDLHYINVPIMVKYFVIPSVAIEAGPYVGFNIKSEAKYESTVTAAGVTETDKSTEDMKEGTSSVDFGLGFGASYNLDNGFFAGVRYNLGLSKVSKEYSETVEGVEYKYPAYDFKNGVFQVSVGYKF